MLGAPDEGARHVFAEERFRQALRFETALPASRADLDEGARRRSVLRCPVAARRVPSAEAGALIETLAPPTTRRERVERGVLAALAVLDADVEQANALMHEVIAAARPQRLMWTILSAGPGVHRLLSSCTVGADLEPFVADLIGASTRTIAPVRRDVGARRLVEPLTAREITVLRYLCSRLTYEEIAAALYVSLNTLKSHVKSVYRKLATASRADAVRAGRELNLI